MYALSKLNNSHVLYIVIVICVLVCLFSGVYVTQWLRCRSWKLQESIRIGAKWWLVTYLNFYEFLFHSLPVVIDDFPKFPFLKIQLLSYNSGPEGGCCWVVNFLGSWWNWDDIFSHIETYVWLVMIEGDETQCWNKK
jgi:hypothetical protein